VLKDLIAHGHNVRQPALSKSRLTLHCMATGAGYEQRGNEAYSWDGLKRGPSPFLVIQHTISGRGQLDFAGARHVLRPGDTMLLTFPHANRYWLERGDTWEYFWLVLNGREALRVVRATIDAAGPVLRLPQPAIDRMAAACLMLIDGGASLPGEASAAAYAAIMALHDGVFGKEATETQAQPGPVLRARSYIEANLGDRLDIDRLAQAAMVSRAHFVRLFSRAMGVPPSDYVFHRRMDRAARLLLATDGPIGAIARAAGFADGNYFAKAFRRAFGVSPSRYRATGTSLLPRQSEP
jgi:AraC family transcriptional regulator